MLYADGIGDDSVNDCRQDERGVWSCEEQQAVGAAPFWQSVDHWNFAETVSPSSAPWGSFKEGRAYSYPRESTCSECVGTPVGTEVAAPGLSTKNTVGITLAAVVAVAMGAVYFLTKE